jgi:hypothetical protein
MAREIVQDFAGAQVRCKRRCVGVGWLIVAMAVMIEAPAVLKLHRFDFTILAIFTLAGGCLWWGCKYTQLRMYQQSLISWQAADGGLKWANASGKSGNLLWSEIVQMYATNHALRLICRQLEPDGFTHERRFLLYVSPEEASRLQAEWSSGCSKKPAPSV